MNARALEALEPTQSSLSSVP